MKHCAMLIALATLAGLSTGANAADFSYSYLEITADLSKTRNTAPALWRTMPMAGCSGSGLLGIVRFVLRQGLMVEGDQGVRQRGRAHRVDLDSRQTVTALGAGYHFEAGERTGVYAEALVIVDFEVEHSIPLVTPSAFGPPTVTTTQSVIEGNGLGGALGIRTGLPRTWNSKPALAHPYPRDVPRTGGKISDSETMLRIGGHVHASGGVSVGGHFSYSKHTDDNFDNIRSSASRCATISEPLLARCRAASHHRDGPHGRDPSWRPSGRTQMRSRLPAVIVPTTERIRMCRSRTRGVACGVRDMGNERCCRSVETRLMISCSIWVSFAESRMFGEAYIVDSRAHETTAHE